ncbi:hypothetical protein ECAA86_00041 [Escherichia coli AA86]|nr:hypothetical protein ECAA86_00041 [Escherichia coli AA86]EZJ47367.1 hypothetical protein AC93_4726 [Escherichia coli 2-005-03_S4_C2]KDT24109.1 hypothetical protein AC67_4958 [Escherichia coli 2-052-05_S4_C1]KEL52161.1 hypothetical protein AB22_1057 [Escherichia coli 6-175-07_S1_C1]
MCSINANVVISQGDGKCVYTPEIIKNRQREMISLYVCISMMLLVNN